MFDMNNNPVEPGDYLLDSRGHVHEVRHTDPTIVVGGVIYTYEVNVSHKGKLTRNKESYVHREFCVLASKADLTAPVEVRKNTYDAVFLQQRSAELTEFFAERRAFIQDLIRQKQKKAAS